MHRIIAFLVACFFILFTQPLVAQTVDSLSAAGDSLKFDAPAQEGKFKYALYGIVKEKKTGEPVPYATVFFPYTEVGTVTDSNGKFELFFNDMGHDTLRVVIMGYKSLSTVLPKKPGRNITVLELESSANLLDEVVIHAGEDPAITIIKNVIRHRPANDPARLDNYGYEAYNKVEVDILNLSKKDFERLPIPYVKQLTFIYNNLDTTGKQPFLPFFLTESFSDYYYQKQPFKAREYVKASQYKGIRNESIAKYLGKSYLSIYPYDNFISFFDKKYVSPISNVALAYYKYKILDTAKYDGYKVIRMSYRPQRSGENCFTGELQIVDSVFALKYIDADLPAAANINWVKNANFYQDFSYVNDSIWFCTKENLTAELILSNELKLPGFIVRRTTDYRNIVTNDTGVTKMINSGLLKADVTIADSARDKTEEYWNNVRVERLNKNEAGIYNMFDSLEANRTYRKFKYMIRIFTTGGAQFGPIEIGPYWNLYSNNAIEGNRFRFSMGTTPKLFKDIYLNGYVAYGTKDERWKYNLNALWLLGRKPRSFIQASVIHDIDRTLNYYNDRVSFDNLFNVAIRKGGIPRKFVFSTEYKAEYFKEYFNGFSYNLLFLNKTYDPYDPLPSNTIFTNDAGDHLDMITNTEATIRLRYAYRERFAEGNYLRFSLGSKYPITDFRYSRGIKNVFNSGFQYNKFTLSITDNIRIAPLGDLYVNVFGGKIYGKLPYTLLEIHPGNETYFYSKYAFSFMNQFNYISDQYAGVNIEHSIGGGIFNYIPLIKKLKFRQFWTAKGLIGSLSKDNAALNLNKGFEFKTLNNNPYVEVGTGIENIFRLFRIDFVWRLLPKPLPTDKRAQHFGIFGSVKLDF